MAPTCNHHPPDGANLQHPPARWRQLATPPASWRQLARPTRVSCLAWLGELPRMVLWFALRIGWRDCVRMWTGWKSAATTELGALAAWDVGIGRGKNRRLRSQGYVHAGSFRQPARWRQLAGPERQMAPACTTNPPDGASLHDQPARWRQLAGPERQMAPTCNHHPPAGANLQPPPARWRQLARPTRQLAPTCTTNPPVGANLHDQPASWRQRARPTPARRSRRLTTTGQLASTTRRPRWNFRLWRGSRPRGRHQLWRPVRCEHAMPARP
jgi:hypothetical protein